MPDPNAHPILFYNNTLYIVRKNNENPWFYRSISLLLRYLLCVCKVEYMTLKLYCDNLDTVTKYIVSFLIRRSSTIWNVFLYIFTWAVKEYTVCDNRMCLWMSAWVFFLLISPWYCSCKIIYITHKYAHKQKRFTWKISLEAMRSLSGK